MKSSAKLCEVAPARVRILVLPIVRINANESQKGG